MNEAKISTAAETTKVLEEKKKKAEDRIKKLLEYAKKSAKEDGMEDQFMMPQYRDAAERLLERDEQAKDITTSIGYFCEFARRVSEGQDEQEVTRALEAEKDAILAKRAAVAQRN